MMCFQQRIDPIQKLASQMEEKLAAVESKIAILESRVSDPLDLSRDIDQKMEHLESSVEERIALTSKNAAVSTERLTELQNTIDDTRSALEKTQALIPDLSSLHSKVDQIDVALTDYKTTTDSSVDAAGSERLLALENSLAKLHQRMFTLEHSTKEHEVSSMKTSTKDTCQGCDNPPSPKS